MRHHRPHAASTVFRLSLLASAVSLAIAAPTASAQTTKSDEKKADDAKLETITVTAQRREQELQSVPLPVSTFTARDLELRNVTTTQAIADYTPNMVGQNNTGLGAANVYFIRGLGNTESIATFDPPVGTYVNDVYVARQAANNFAFFDVERVEVLRGPQGTLFGRNTTGGAVNVILKKPGKKLSGYLELGAGDWSYRNSRGSVDIPISDTFSTKFSYYYNKDDGFVRSITTGDRLNKRDNVGVRGAFSWRVAPGVIWDLAIDNTIDKGDNTFSSLVNGERITRTGLRVNNPGFFSASGAPLLRGAKNGFGNGNEIKANSITSNVGFSVGSANIEFISGWRDTKQKYAVDFGNMPVPSGGFTIANDARFKQFTQEVKATGDVGAVSYVAGAFYMKEDNDTDFGDILNTVFSGAPAPGATLVLADRFLKSTTKSTAAYAQADWKFMEKWTATLGVRNTKETKSISFTDLRLTPPANSATLLNNANITAVGIPLTQDTTLTTPRVAIAHQMDKDLMFFWSYTEGFKSGGWNARGTTPGALQPFRPEKVRSYEAGWRMTGSDNTWRVNGTLFLMKVKEAQITAGVTTPTGVQFLNANFADMRNVGFELEIAATPMRGLNTYLNFGAQNANYENLSQSVRTQQNNCLLAISAGTSRTGLCGSGIVKLDGTISDPVRVPPTSINPGFNYTGALGVAGLKFSFGANMSYQAAMKADVANTAISRAHSSYNASISLISGKDDWRITADCTNCDNATWINARLAGLDYLNAPRRTNVRFIYTFK